MSGELFALGAALCWAVGSLLFSRARVAAPAINLFKNLLACTALALVLVVLLPGAGVPRLALGLEGVLWLAASSAVGLVLGDTCHFRSLQILGPRRCIVLETLAPPLSALTGYLFLGERLGTGVALGMAVTLGGIVLVVLERTADVESAGVRGGTARQGVGLGLLAALCQAVGATWSKSGMLALAGAGTDPGVVALLATFVRLLVAVLLGLLLGALGARLAVWTAQVRAPGQLRVMVPAALAGTLLGVWLSLLSFQHASVAVATTLCAMSPVFILPLVVLVLKQRISAQGALGALLAVLGVAVLFLV